MTNIKISELLPAGYELFQDYESFLNELTEQETNGIVGGFFSFDLLSIQTEIKTIETKIKTEVASVFTQTVRTYGISHTLKTVIKY